MPGRNQLIHHAGILRPTFPFTKGIETVGQLTNSVSLGSHGRQKYSRFCFAFLKGFDKVVESLPCGNSMIGHGIPVGWIFGIFQKTDFSSSGFEDATLFNTFNACSLGPRKGVRLSKKPFSPSISLQTTKDKTVYRYPEPLRHARNRRQVLY